MIHPSAEIENGAKIASDVKIAAFCRVGKDAVLENGVVLEPHVHVSSNVTVGENTHLYSFSKIGDGATSIIIGKDCTIREFTEIGIKKNKNREPIAIGDNCYIMAYVDIREGVIVEDNCIITNNVILHHNSKCETKVIMGAKAALAENCTIGSGSMIGGASSVKHDIPPFCLVEGWPDAHIRGLNIIGMRRGFKDKESIKYVKRAFMELKKQDFDNTLAQKMLSQADDIHARKFLDFVATHAIEI